MASRSSNTNHAVPMIAAGWPTTLLSAVCGLLSIIYFACGTGGTRMHQKEDPSQLSRDLALPMPPGTRVIAVKRLQGIDVAIFAKVEVPTDAWSSWLDAAPFKADELTTEANAYLAPDDGWWDPSRAVGLKAVQLSLPHGKYLNLGVSEANTAGVVVVYLMKHGT
jgi:hypothetical protein